MKKLLPSSLFFKRYNRNRSRIEKNEHQQAVNTLKTMIIIAYFISISVIIKLNVDIALVILSFAGVLFLISSGRDPY